MKQTERSSPGLYMIGIAALFLAGFFLLVVVGAQSYRNTVAVQDDNMRTRALLSYFSTCVKAYDAENAVSIRDTETGTLLEIADGDSGYGLRIYQHQGKLLEEYASLSAPLQPEEAQIIGDTELFEVTRQDDLLTIATDAGTVLVRLRSEGGAVG